MTSETVFPMMVMAAMSASNDILLTKLSEAIVKARQENDLSEVVVVAQMIIIKQLIGDDLEEAYKMIRDFNSSHSVNKLFTIGKQ